MVASCKLYLEQPSKKGHETDSFNSTYADLSFIPWDRVVEGFSKDMLEEMDAEKKYPNFFAWHRRLIARPSVKKVYGE